MAEIQIFTQPFSQTVAEGMRATLTVTTSPAEKFQWYKDGNPVPGAWSRFLTFPAASLTNSGLYHVVVTLGVESATSEPARLTVVPRANLRLVSTIPDEGNAMCVKVIDNIAYVADRYLRIYDVSDPENVIKLGEFGKSTFEIRAFFVSGTFAYVPDYKSSQFFIVDISDPAAPAELGKILLLNTPADVVVRQGLAYVATFRGLEIIDVSNPARPERLSHYGTDTFFTVDITSDVVYLAANRVPSHVVDISDPTQPQQIGLLSKPAWADTAKVRGERLYISGKDNYIYDISNPRQPRYLGNTTPNGSFGTAGMDATERFIFTGGDGLTLFDASDPANAFPIGRYKSSTYKPEWVDVAGNLIFVAVSTGVDILEWTPAGAAPVVTTALMPTLAVKGSGAALFGHASGGEPLNWQWFRNGGLLVGETNNILHIPPFTEPDGSVYSLSAINTVGSTTLGSATLTLVEPPPLDLSIQFGDSRGPRLIFQFPEGLQGHLEATSDFGSWSTLWSGQVRENPLELFDTYGRTLPQRTYRFRYGLH